MRVLQLIQCWAFGACSWKITECRERVRERKREREREREEVCFMNKAALFLP